MLFLTDQYAWSIFMDRSFYHQYEASKRHPCVVSDLWGLGMPGYDNDLPLRENIRQKFGREDYFDVIYIFGNFRPSELFELADMGAVTAHREFECFDARCKGIFDNGHYKVSQLSYMVDMHFYISDSFSRVISHSPHCADPGRVFSASRDAARPIDLYLAGAISAAYPLRQRWVAFSDQLKLPITYRTHPTYFSEPFVKYEPWSEKHVDLVRTREEQVLSYAQDLKQAKILLTDSSVYKYALMKYIEATMAGCLIIGYIPNDFPDMYRQFVVEVDKSMTDDQLIEIVNYWLENSAERIERVRKGQQLLMPEFTWDTSVDRLIDSVNAYRAGRYGMYYGGQFIQTCTATNSLVGNYHNEWCHNYTAPSASQ